jgi:acyl carrier protein
VPETSIQKDLKVNSARLVDVVLEMEERFGIQVKDEDAEKVRTVGDAVSLVLRQQASA